MRASLLRLRRTCRKGETVIGGGDNSRGGVSISSVAMISLFDDPIRPNREQLPF
jgi:hypothetical protein